MKGALALALLAPAAFALAKDPELKTSPLAQAFGSAPALWDPHLSPDGSKISFIRMHEQGATLGVVLDTVTGKVKVVIAGDRDKFDITWCDWANNERLLCGLGAVILNPPSAYATTRLVAVNYDGTAMKVLLDFKLRDTFAQYQDRVIDWLPEDDRKVLVQLPAGDGTGVSRLDIYSGDIGTEERVRESAYRWISDGHGVPRLYHVLTDREERWDVRDKPEQNAAFSNLHRVTLEQGADDAFEPIGFGENRNELLYIDRHEGRKALFGIDLAGDRKTRLIYAHPTVDVESVLSFGKYRRLVAASYVTDRPHFQFFDERVADMYTLLSRSLPNKQISILDEDWARRYYLVYAGSDEDPGMYYRFDSERRELVAISSNYPTLKNRPLSPMHEVNYPAKDGTLIPAYLTVPAAGGSGRKPAIILPHGGHRQVGRDHGAVLRGIIDLVHGRQWPIF